MSAAYAVIVIELESDTPDVERTYGPFEYDEAEFVVESLEQSGKVRGESVQVSLLEGYIKESAS